MPVVEFAHNQTIKNRKFDAYPKLFHELTGASFTSLDRYFCDRDPFNVLLSPATTLIALIKVQVGIKVQVINSISNIYPFRYKL